VPASDITVNSGDTIDFDASYAKDTDPSVAIARYNWNFGNGTTGTSTGTGYPYAYTNTSGADAVYTVSLTATDADGATSPIVTRHITVHSASSGPDTQAPTVSGAETGTSGTIHFTAIASDNVGVTKVQFLVDGVLKAADTSSPYGTYFNSTTLADGPHTLTVKAYDAANNIGTSSDVPFTVNNGGADHTAPTCSGAVTGTSGTIHFTATASDNVGVTKVAFYVDGVLRAADTGSPYGTYFNSTLVANGSHTLTVKAYDAAGNVGTAAGVPFTVAN
jgi:hypothetical protein